MIDNHAPYGFHEHDELPENHESRVTIHVKSWQEAFGEIPGQMSGDNKMRLKFLNIVFKESNEFFADINKALKSGKGLNTRSENVLIFDSVKTFNNVMTVNKIQILRTISQLRPESVYQLAMTLNRVPQHVLKDCRQLEAFKFIKLEVTDSGRGSLRPILAFDYDVIRIDSPLVSPYTISERSERLLFGKRVAV